MNNMLFPVRLCQLWSLNSSELTIKVHKSRKNGLSGGWFKQGVPKFLQAKDPKTEFATKYDTKH